MVHILCADCISVSEEAYQTLYRKASPERQARADGYRRREDSVRCVISDALVRHAMRQSLGCSDFSVEKYPGGKPFVPAAPDFQFNLSHSGRWVVIAWSGNALGVDVEKMDMDPGKERIARRFFTQEEQEFVFAQESEASHRFFQVWTGKESYLKYLGTGLQKSLSAFSTLALSAMLKSMELPGGYLLTLCTEDPEYTVAYTDAARLSME